MSPFGFAGLQEGVASTCFGLLVFFKGTNRRIVRVWSIFIFTVALWGFGTYAVSLANGANEALLIWTLLYTLCVPWMAASFYHFVCVFLEVDRTRLVYINYLIAFTFAVLIGLKRSFHVEWMFDSLFYIRGGRIYMAHLAWWMVCVFYSHYLLLGAYRKVVTEKKRQIKYFFLATGLGFTGGSMCYLPSIGVMVYPYGNFTTVLYPFIMSYAILKHQLMDVRLVIRKTLICAVVTGVLAACMVVVAVLSARFTEGLLGRQTITLVLTSLFITAIFHPLQLKIQTFVDHYLFRDWADRPFLREVAAGFSHELKSPLAGLSMQAQMMLAELEEMGDDPQVLRKALPRIKQELHYLVNKSMEAARRIEAVRGVAEPAAGQIEPVDITAVLDSSLVALTPLLNEVAPDIRRAIPGNLPPVRSNLKQLEIVFINLMKNALEAMDGLKRAERHVLALAGSELDGSVLVSIKDSGAGIASKDLGRVFEPHFTTKGRKGTGMGLFLSHQIIKAHGGSLDVRSVEGKGTEFIVRLPKFAEKAAA